MRSRPFALPVAFAVAAGVLILMVPVPSGASLLVVIALIALVAILACAVGQVWGPVLVGLGFAGLGALLLAAGHRSPWPEIGLWYICGSLVEFAAAREFWRCKGTEGGPPVSWRAISGLLGVAGSLLSVVLLALAAAAAFGFIFSLDAPRH